jgi:hypothetical protein
MKILNSQKNKVKTRKYRNKTKKNKVKTRKYRNKTQKKKSKKYSGGFIVPPPKIQPQFSVTNPTVSAEDSGSPYQRVNNQLQANTKNQANLNKTLNGQASKTSGGKNKKKRNILMRKY